MNNEDYYFLKEIYSSIPKDKRTFEKQILNYQLSYLKSLRESINRAIDNKENIPLMDNMVMQDINKTIIHYLKNFGVDRTDLLNSNLSNLEIYSKLLQDIESIAPKNNKINLMFFIPILHKFYYVLLYDYFDIDSNVRSVIFGLFCELISLSLGLTVNNEVKVYLDNLLVNNKLSKNEYNMLYKYYIQIDKYNKKLNKHYNNTEPIRLFPHVFLTVFLLSEIMISDEFEKFLTHYNIKEISEEEKNVIQKYFSGFLDFYYVNRNAKKCKKIILSSYFINILEEKNETLGDKKLNQGELQLLWCYIGNNNEDIMLRLGSARRKSLDKFLDECRQIYKEDNTVFESAKGRYNKLKKDIEVLNEEEFNAFILLYLFFDQENYKFRKDVNEKYKQLFVKYPIFEFIKYIHKKHLELQEKGINSHLYDFMSLLGTEFK